MNKILLSIVIFLYWFAVVCSVSTVKAVTVQNEPEQPEVKSGNLGNQSTDKFPKAAYDIYKELNKALELGELAETSKQKVIDNFAPALIGEWSHFAIDNAILADSKFIDNPVKIYDLTIANEQRIYNVSFTYFPTEKQIYFTRKEYINSSAENVLLALDEAKKDDELNLKFESAATHFFERENYADYLTVKIADVSGMISFVNSGIINVITKAELNKETVEEDTREDKSSESVAEGSASF
ncbi:hypothetical protein [Glaciecola petra]|uniref:Uncharacterized protein n=1 Tax=Glaciecola petra TaxID=3075602 RepID=A0ABU2ZU13_9ALTE|nr:hypothetical protein [Aestuariibacter sp. P117]MDT0596132.1 hypothetical protein [Aestuariibacter sp. P117]